MNEFFDKVPAASQTITVALETGTHSAWISRQLEARGHEVIVAHARDLAFIYKGDKKSDRIDAEKLALTIRFVNFGTCNSGKKGYVKIRRFTPIV